MTGTWLAKRRKDQYYRLARIRGYRSRSAYKLQQTIRTYGIVKPGQKVVDLGAQPGGWLQIARETVGPEGLVLGIDIKEIQPLHSPNVKLLKMDVYADDVPDRIIAELGGPANTVLSDLAPSIIGAWDVDHARQVDLARRALDIAEKVLDHHGNVLIKLFEGPERRRLQDDAALYFERSRLFEHYSASGLKIEGMTTREVRERNARTGFMITDLSSGQEGWLAKKDLTAGPRVGSYVVVSEDLEKIGVAALERSMNGPADLVIVDEIGPMEMTSASFRNNLSRVLNGNRAVIATVKFGSRYPEVEKTWHKSVHWEITKENRESIYRKIIRQVDDWISEYRRWAS